MKALGNWRWRRRLRRMALDVFDDFVLRDGVDGYVHIENVLLRPEGLFVLDELEGTGRLIAGERLPEWTLVGKRRRFVFPNPLRRLADKLTAMRLIAGRVPVHGFIVLADGLKVPRAQPEQVVGLSELARRLPHLPSDAALAPATAEAWSRIREAAASPGH